MNHLEDAKRLLNEFYQLEEGTMPAESAIATGIMIANESLIAIAEQLEVSNKLKYLEMKGNPNFKLKPDDLLKFFKLEAK